MDERLQFVARRLTGAPMAELCREFGISRKTGYKISDRYQECEITAGMVGDGQRVAILPIAQQEFALVIGAPQLIGILAQG